MVPNMVSFCWTLYRKKALRSVYMTVGNAHLPFANSLT